MLNRPTLGMAQLWTTILLFVAVLQLSTTDDSRESKKIPEKYLNIPERIIGGVIDYVHSHKNKPYLHGSSQQEFQQGGNYQSNQGNNQGYQQWSSQNAQNNQLQGQFVAPNQGAQGFMQIGNNQGIYTGNNVPNYQGQTQIQISNQQANNQFQAQNQQNQQNQFQNQVQSNQFQNQNQIQTGNRFENMNSNQQTGQYQVVNQQPKPQYQGSNSGYGQYQTGNIQGGSFQSVNQQVGNQYPVPQQPVTPVTQYPTITQTGGQYQGSIQQTGANQENYFQGTTSSQQFAGGNYQSGQTAVGQNGSQFSQGSTQNGSGSGPGPTCICQAWTKPMSDEPVEQQYTPSPKLDYSFEPTTLLV